MLPSHQRYCRMHARMHWRHARRLSVLISRGQHLRPACIRSGYALRLAWMSQQHALSFLDQACFLPASECDNLLTDSFHSKNCRNITCFAVSERTHARIPTEANSEYIWVDYTHSMANTLHLGPQQNLLLLAKSLAACSHRDPIARIRSKVRHRPGFAVAGRLLQAEDRSALVPRAKLSESSLRLLCPAVAQARRGAGPLWPPPRRLAAAGHLCAAAEAWDRGWKRQAGGACRKMALRDGPYSHTAALTSQYLLRLCQGGPWHAAGDPG
jgi:hypothetical protein